MFAGEHLLTSYFGKLNRPVKFTGCRFGDSETSGFRKLEAGEEFPHLPLAHAHGFGGFFGGGRRPLRSLLPIGGRLAPFGVSFFSGPICCWLEMRLIRLPYRHLLGLPRCGISAPEELEEKLQVVKFTT